MGSPVDSCQSEDHRTDSYTERNRSVGSGNHAGGAGGGWGGLGIPSADQKRIPPAADDDSALHRKVKGCCLHVLIGKLLQNSSKT